MKFSFLSSIKRLGLTIVGSVVLTLCLLTASCSGDREGWTIKGDVKGGADKTLYIERLNGNAWLLLDSVTVNGDGTFSYTAEDQADGRNIYAIRLGDKRVRFLPNGQDVLTLTADASAFNEGHSIKGNYASEGFSRTDSIITDAVRRVGKPAASNDSIMLAALGNMIINDTTCEVAYYVMTSEIDGTPIFRLDDISKFKIRLINAAANRFAQLRPSDPRATELADIFSHARKLTGTSTPTAVRMEASLSGRPNVDFVREDFHGVKHDLNKVLDRGGVTVLNLIRFDDPRANAVNLALREANKKYKDRGLEIYQVSFDPNKATWTQIAPSLPWTVVHNGMNESAEILVKFMADPIQGAPVSFVVNKEGEIVARVENPANLDAELAKVF